MKKFILALTGVAFMATSNAQMNTKILGTDRNETATHIKKLSDGSTIIGGIIYDIQAGTPPLVTNSDIFVLRLDAADNLQWVRTIDGPGNEYIQDMIISSGSEDIILVGNGRPGTAVTSNNTAFIQRMDNNGNHIGSSTFRDANSGNIAGEVFFGVAELSNGNLAVVGTNNIVGNQSAGLICVFNASASLLYHEVYDISPGNTSDEFRGVATDGTDIYICGFVEQGSGHDMRVSHYTPGSISGTMHYDRRYDFTPAPGETNNYASDIYLQGSTLLIGGVSSTPCCGLNDNKQSILRVDASTGNSIDVNAFNTGNTFANTTHFIPLSSDRVFFTQNPSQTNSFDPFTQGFAGNVNAVVSDFNLSTSTTNLARQFINTGDQAIVDIMDDGGVLRMVGSINGAPVTFGNRDIYYVSSAYNLTDTREECDIDDYTYQVETPGITEASIAVLPVAIQTEPFESWIIEEFDMNIGLICGDTVVKPSEGCEEDCYWTLLGNGNVTSNHFVGSKNNAELRFRTVNQERAIIDTEGDFGINLFQTSNLPDAKLHVFCDLNEEQTQGHSNIRFEELMEGDGDMLVIDDMGYVYRVPAPDGGEARNEAQEEKIQQLEQRIEELQRKMDILLQSTSGGSLNMDGVALKLFPNPTGGDVNVQYQLPANTNGAVLMITDVAGRTIHTQELNDSNGELHITIPASVASGELSCTIVSEGQVVINRKLILNRK